MNSLGKDRIGEIYWSYELWSILIKRIMTSQTFLATEKRALDPAEIEEFYSTISAWRPAACNIPL